MTAQISDLFDYRGKSFWIVGKKGSGLFDPEALGIRCEMMSTACWRGYRVDYTLLDGELRIASLGIQLAGWGSEDLPAKSDKQPVVPIFGADAKEVDQFGHATYENIGSRMPFTGGLLLGDDFIEELYVHMGFHPAWKFRTVHELKFEDGRLVSEVDRSAAIAETRRRLAAQPRGPNGTTEAAVMSWIEQTFDESYV